MSSMDFGLFGISGDLGECPHSRLHLGFPALSGRHVFYSMFNVFCIGLGPCIDVWPSANDWTCIAL